MNMLKSLILLSCLVVTQALYGMFDAAKKGDFEKVETLLKQGAKVNAKNRSGNTALIQAAFGGKEEVVKLLLEYDAEVDGKGKNGGTALIWAASQGHMKVVKILIEHGAKVNEQDNKGKTALICAVGKKHNDVAKLLFMYADKETLEKYPRYELVLLDKNVRNYIFWILTGSLRKNLVKDALQFAPIAFAMPHFVDEFESMLPFVHQHDYSKIFTAEPIQNALMTKNLKAFEILIAQAQKDGNNNLIKSITNEVNNFDRTKFNAKFLDSIGALVRGTKITGMKKAQDIGFKFH